MGQSSSGAPSKLEGTLFEGQSWKKMRIEELMMKRGLRRNPGPVPPYKQAKSWFILNYTMKIWLIQSESGLDLFTLIRTCLECMCLRMRLTWDHRGQRSQDMKVRLGTLGTRSWAGSCKAWDSLVSVVWVEPLPVHCGGYSRVLGFGMLGNAVGSWAQ